MQPLSGARYLDVEQTLGWQFNGNIGALPLAASGSRSVDDSLWDGIIGVRGRASFGANREWFVPYYVDIGTGQSDFTWQRHHRDRLSVQLGRHYCRLALSGLRI